MNKHETQDLNSRLLDIYCGILFNQPSFEEGEAVTLLYDFDCPEYSELKKRYPLKKTAGRGGDFEHALRLCRWLAPRLKHVSDFDNSVPCNSLALLDYCFEKPELGINCVNKAKILAECCLALGIYARRVWMFPNSPYDMDNHVVTEIYDRWREKWIALDPSTGGYFSKGERPLSCLELRNSFAEHSPVSVVLNRQNPAKISELCLRNIELNSYYAKNSCYFAVETVSAFGKPDGYDAVYVVPKGLDVKRIRVQKAKYFLEVVRKGNYPESFVKMMEESYEYTLKEKPLRITSAHVWDRPESIQESKSVL
ncbi:MAG: hypothetical protein J1F60_05380 [Oscillospiraceae bacterium]|nr:hypothetical protein [Oscillospiraceae bacterium]